jgi:hypothetical protein
LGPLRLGHQLFTHWSFLLRGSNCGPYFQFVIVYLITSYEP